MEMSTYKKKKKSIVAITIRMLIVCTFIISLGKTQDKQTKKPFLYSLVKRVVLPIWSASMVETLAPEVSDQGKGTFMFNSRIT